MTGCLQEGGKRGCGHSWQQRQLHTAGALPGPLQLGESGKAVACRAGWWEGGWVLVSTFFP